LAKKKIHKLTFSYENDFHLIGIASHENDYRLSWAINASLRIDLTKEKDFTIHHPKNKIEANYSMYGYSDLNNYNTYHLISNKSEKGFLLPELKNIDFILRVTGFSELDSLDVLLKKLKKIDIIITAFHIEIPEKQKSLFVF